MSLKITLLGTGTNQLLPSRKASSVLINHSNNNIVYDFGRGIADRLTELGLKQDDLSNVIISHFHTDHTSDLIPYIHAAISSRIDPRTKDLHLYGSEGIKELIENKVIDNFVPNYHNQDKFQITSHEINKRSFCIEGLDFTTKQFKHHNNKGIRFQYKKHKIAITGDSDDWKEQLKLISNADLAIIDSGHITESEISKLASKSKAKKIVCSHIYKDKNTNKIQKNAKKDGYKGEILNGKDLMEFNFQ